MISKKKKKLIRVTTIAESYIHIFDQLKILSKEYDLFLICGPGAYQEKLQSEIQAEIITIDIPRGIEPVKDMKALFKLYLIFRELMPDMVHSSMPKAGLLSSLASFFALVPKRFHTFTGQRWVDMRGIKKLFFKFLDSLILQLNTWCFCDAPSQKTYLSSQGLPTKRLNCLHKGCFGGVDTDRFDPSLFSDQREKLEREFQIKATSIHFLYAGRIVNDKGITEALMAFDEVSKSYDCDFLLAGNYEPDLDPISSEAKELIENHPRIHYLGFFNKTEEIYGASDIYVIPSYREGFGTAIMEASAMELPLIATDIPGLKDGLVHGKTGLYVQKKDVSSLVRAMEYFLKEPQKIQVMGKESRKRVIKDFDYRVIAKAQLEEYRRHLLY